MNNLLRSLLLKSWNHGIIFLAQYFDILVNNIDEWLDRGGFLENVNILEFDEILNEKISIFAANYLEKPPTSGESSKEYLEMIEEKVKKYNDEKSVLQRLRFW